MAFHKMFKGTYQGGAVFEIFSAQGKESVDKWKLCGGPSAIHKEYNKEVKGFVYCLEGSSQTVKMQLPVNGKISLGLIQRFVVLQVNIPQGHNFSTELVVTDLEHLKRRLHFSTVHKKLSATPLHAKIPLAELKHDTWSSLCIDLVSLTGELFRGFSSLDGITLFATCKVRRIFTTKIEPGEVSDDDVSLSGACLMETIPASLCYPPDVKPITRVLDMKNLQKAQMKTECLSCAPDHPSVAATSTKYQGTKPQGVLHIASSTRASTAPPKTRGKSAISNRTDRPSSLKNQKLPSQTVNFIILGKNSSHGQAPSRLHEEADPVGQSETSVSRESCPLPSSQHGSRQQLLTPSEKSVHRTADSRSCRAAESRHQSASPYDLKVLNSWESNEGSEPQLTLLGEVFTFSSQPHFPKRGQSRGDSEEMGPGDGEVQGKSGGRRHAQPEDDFIGSESDEDDCHIMFQHQKNNISCPTSPRASVNTEQVLSESDPESLNMSPNSLNQDSPFTWMQSLSSGREPAWPIPIRCLSSNRNYEKSERGGQDLIENEVDSFCGKMLQNVYLVDIEQEKEDCDSSAQRGEDDDEEFQMLESLKRQQDEDECRSLGLNTSQIQQCDVDVSLSIDDVSTWTHFSLPGNQGHHYQMEMNPLLQSNPREWMDVLSPPIMPPSLQRRSGNAQNNLESLLRGEDELVREEESEDELKVLYDLCLNCYFDPETGNYYESA